MKLSRRILPALAAVVAGAATLGSLSASSPATRSLLALERTAGPAAVAALERTGADRVDPALPLWSVDDDDLGQALDAVDGHVAAIQPMRRYAANALTAKAVEPLAAGEWWRGAVNATGLVPPGPGVPIAIVDSGVDAAHPDFQGRTIETLNAPAPTAVGGTHGTMVASLIGAATNGVGFEGLYPLATIRSWDAAPRGPQLDSAEVAAGILAAARAGRSVINLSLGGPKDLALELAVDEAQALGSLIVAASGNSGDEANELSYPAVLPRVLTVGATNRDNRVAPFSSFSPYVDVAAPGEAVQVAETVLDTATNQPLRRWGESDGTSFASPLVAGAAAWIWTVRPRLTADQVAEVLRLSARDIDTPGRDPRSGFGIVDLSAALALPDPPRDAREPNDDIEYVSPDGDRNVASPPPLLAAGRTRGALSATIDRWEDPRDVYRVWAAARTTLGFTVTSTADNDLAVFKPGAISVTGRDSVRDRLALGRVRGKVEKLVFRNTGSGRWVYAAVTLPKGVDRATYRLAVAASPAR